MHTKDEILNMVFNSYKEGKIELDIEFIKDNLLFLVLSGSRAYGTDTENSDYDYRGICFPPLDFYLSSNTFEQVEDKNNDITIFSISKIFQLAKNVNPNIVELFFVDEKSIIYKHPLMDKILENKHLFLSKRAEHSFSGYAVSQLKRIINHKKWIDNPLQKPDRKNYNLPISPRLSQDKLRSLATLSQEDLKEFLSQNDVEYVFNEIRYLKDKNEYDKYRQWKKNRNPERAKLEEKHGYDTKHGMHLFRLMRCAKEIATEHTLHTYRPDRDFLGKIRDGHFTYEEVIEMATREEQEIHDLFDKSTLKNSVNHKKIDELLLSILKEFYNIV